jgi:hypothetical protein
MRFSLFIVFLLFSFTGTAQNTIEWREDYTLKPSDFLADPPSGEMQKVLGTFSVSYEMGGLNLITKRNLNENVSCIFEQDESYISNADEAATLDMLRYQQLMFNLYEVQARALRKTFYEKRKELLTKGPASLREAVSREHEKLIADVESQTQYGHVAAAMNKWEKWTKNELEKLSDFCKTCNPKKKK